MKIVKTKYSEIILKEMPTKSWAQIFRIILDNYT